MAIKISREVARLLYELAFKMHEDPSEIFEKLVRAAAEKEKVEDSNDD